MTSGSMLLGRKRSSEPRPVTTLSGIPNAILAPLIQSWHPDECEDEGLLPRPRRRVPPSPCPSPSGPPEAASSSASKTLRLVAALIERTTYCARATTGWGESSMERSCARDGALDDPPVSSLPARMPHCPAWFFPHAKHRPSAVS